MFGEIRFSQGFCQNYIWDQSSKQIYQWIWRPGQKGVYFGAGLYTDEYIW